MSDEIVLRSVRCSGGELEWEFSCECGRETCDERVCVTIGAYVALHDGGELALAPGHEVSRAGRARRRSEELRQESTALRAQAQHQKHRAKKNGSSR